MRYTPVTLDHHTSLNYGFRKGKKEKLVIFKDHIIITFSFMVRLVKLAIAIQFNRNRG